MARVMGLGVSRKVENTGERMPNFFRAGSGQWERAKHFILEKFSVQYSYHLDIISMSSEGPLKV